VQTGVDIELPPEEASASLQLWVAIADDALASPVPVGVSMDVSAQALPVTEFIHGEPEPVVVGPLQPLPFLTVNELVPLDQSMPPDSSFLCLPSKDDASPILPPFAENLEKTLLFNPSLNLVTHTDSHSCSNDVASAASSHQADAYVAVLAPVTCQAWLEICRVGKSTNHVAQDRAKEYCDTTWIAPREDAI
jgi:hypothetical protein